MGIKRGLPFVPGLSDYVPGESPVVDHHTLSMPWSGREAINVIELGLAWYVSSAVLDNLHVIIWPPAAVTIINVGTLIGITSINVK